MDFVFRNRALASLASAPSFSLGFPGGVEHAFRKRVQAIGAAADERDLYRMKSHRFEKLKGNRQHQHSMRLNDQFRLILEIRRGTPRNTIVIVGIEDYH